MRAKSFSYTPSALNASGLANDVAYSGGGYALTATTVGSAGMAHIITILGNAATNHSGKTFTITGTGPDGDSQTESIAGPNGVATVSTTKHFKTVTSVTVSATTGADTFDIGWSGVSVGQTIPLDHKSNAFSVSLAVAVTGTINVTVQHTFDDVYDESVTPIWFSHSTIASKTANTDGNYAYPVRATRLLVNSVTAGATVKFHVIQSSDGGC